MDINVLLKAKEIAVCCGTQAITKQFPIEVDHRANIAVLQSLGAGCHLVSSDQKGYHFKFTGISNRLRPEFVAKFVELYGFDGAKVETLLSRVAPCDVPKGNKISLTIIIYTDHVEIQNENGERLFFSDEMRYDPDSLFQTHFFPLVRDLNITVDHICDGSAPEQMTIECTCLPQNKKALTQALDKGLSVPKWVIDLILDSDEEQSSTGRLLEPVSESISRPECSMAELILELSNVLESAKMEPIAKIFRKPCVAEFIDNDYFRGDVPVSTSERFCIIVAHYLVSRIAAVVNRRGDSRETYYSKIQEKMRYIGNALALPEGQKISAAFGGHCWLSKAVEVPLKLREGLGLDSVAISLGLREMWNGYQSVRLGQKRK